MNNEKEKHQKNIHPILINPTELKNKKLHLIRQHYEMYMLLRKKKHQLQTKTTFDPHLTQKIIEDVQNNITIIEKELQIIRKLQKKHKNHTTRQKIKHKLYKILSCIL